ncbi:MAG: hypothetical protein LBR11_01115 [Deltaproteobacteria bacterium]|jgi:hypothetical protein|nr:hypothetical protein [Deltaproteobacteria bacterium]
MSLATKRPSRPAGRPPKGPDDQPDIRQTIMAKAMEVFAEKGISGGVDKKIHLFEILC